MKKWIVCLVLGVLPLLGSTGWLRPEDDGKPAEITCGNDVMHPGDVCEETRRGVVVDTETYEEKVKAAESGASSWASTGRWVQLGIGLALELLGVIGIVVTRRRRANRAPTTADLALGQWPQQHPLPVPSHAPQQPGQPMWPRPQDLPPHQHPPGLQAQSQPRWSHPQQPFGPGR